VEKGKPVQFDDMLVSPAQEKLTDNPEEKHILEYDKEVYAKDALYPEEIVKITVY
jgi:N-acetylglutamate synthase-like GNAT family acetyltransferase